MGRGVSRKSVQRFAAAFALLGVTFYALLLPWHLTSQFAAQLFQAEFGSLTSAMCSSTQIAGKPATPGAPTTSCPICKGLASFHLAIEPAAPAALPLPVAGEPIFASLREDAAGAPALSPRSRGPPTHA